MKASPTLSARVYIGLYDTHSGYVYSQSGYENILKQYIDNQPKVFCISVTPTKYLYSGGQEDGIIVGFINYPLYPKNIEEFESMVMDFAYYAKDMFRQCSVSIEFTDKTLAI